MAGTLLHVYSGVNRCGRLTKPAVASPRALGFPVTVTSACFLHVINLFLHVSLLLTQSHPPSHPPRASSLHSFFCQLNPSASSLSASTSASRTSPIFFFACARLRHPGDLTLWLHLVTDNPDLVIPTTSCFARLVLLAISPEQQKISLVFPLSPPIHCKHTFDPSVCLARHESCRRRAHH